MKIKKQMPIYVFIGLLGINSKKTALTYFGVSVLLAVASIPAGFLNANFFWGVGFLLPALWYLKCIDWVDKKSTWDLD